MLAQGIDQSMHSETVQYASCSLSASSDIYVTGDHSLGFAAVFRNQRTELEDLCDVFHGGHAGADHGALQFSLRNIPRFSQLVPQTSHR